MIFSQLPCANFISTKKGFDIKETYSFSIQIPDECPNCGKSMHPNHLVSLSVNVPNNYEIASIFMCSSCCQFIFTLSRCFDHNNYTVRSIYPLSIENKKITQSIEELSPKFSKIYNQALTAEKNGLDEICGIGYRKALEFLIKDFAIKRHPDDEETIKKAPLSACIKNYCDNEKIKTLSTACAWIGNDETHYVRKHEEYSVTTLKVFIKAVLTYIESELSLDEASELISS